MTTGRGSAFRFFKQSVEVEWSLLDDQELDDTSWFLCKGKSIRAKKEVRTKVAVAGHLQ